jgi:hypothetical protein
MAQVVVSALQGQSPEFKLQSHQKKKKTENRKTKGLGM